MQKIDICIILPFLVWKRAWDFLLCIAYFLSVIRNAPRGWMKTSLTEWPSLAPQTGTIYPFYRFYGYHIVLFYGYYFGPLCKTIVRLYSVLALHSVSLFKFIFYFLKSFFFFLRHFICLIFVSEFRVCFQHSTPTPQCSTRISVSFHLNIQYLSPCCVTFFNSKTWLYATFQTKS